MQPHTKQHRFANWRTLLCTGLLAFAVSANVFAITEEEALEGGITIKSQEAVVHVPVQNATHDVPWVKTPIKPDGDLGDWKANGVLPVKLGGAKHTTWTKGEYAGETDLSVNLYLGYDASHMFVAIEAMDDIAPAPARFEISFANPDSKVIVGWQDVGMRHGPNDLHNVFNVNKNSDVGMYWAKAQNMMDYSVVHEAMGSEAERRALLEQGKAEDPAKAKIFAKAKTESKDGKSTTVFEVAYPWRALLPFDPLKDGRIKFNFVVHDKDNVEGEPREGVLAWMPGIYGITSAAHYTTLLLQPPAKRAPISIFAQLPRFHYVNKDIAPAVSIYNAGAPTSGELRLFATGKAEPLATAAIDLPSGLSNPEIAIHSEKVGLKNASFHIVYADKSGKTIECPVFAPTTGEVRIQDLAEITAHIDNLTSKADAFEKRYDKLKADGFDLTYPKAYLTLLRMFITSSKGALGRGDSDRVVRNVTFLDEVYQEANDYVDMVLKDRTKQFTTPKFKPDKLTLEKGAYHINGKPLFLWGPCTFWFLKHHQQDVIDLGFNSVTPELPMRLGKDDPEVVSHMKNWYDAGILVNASMYVPELNFTGADVRASKLLQEHPEMKNLDQNNFMSFLIQHPRAREEIKRASKTA